MDSAACAWVDWRFGMEEDNGEDVVPFCHVKDWYVRFKMSEDDVASEGQTIGISPMWYEMCCRKCQWVCRPGM